MLWAVKRGRATRLPAPALIRPTSEISRVRSQFVLISICEERCRSTGVPKEHRFALLKNALPDHVDQSRCRAARIHRVKQESFGSGEEADRLPFRVRQYPVSSLTILVVCENFVRAKVDSFAQPLRGEGGQFGYMCLQP